MRARPPFSICLGSPGRAQPPRSASLPATPGCRSFWSLWRLLAGRLGVRLPARSRDAKAGPASSVSPDRTRLCAHLVCIFARAPPGTGETQGGPRLSGSVRASGMFWVCGRAPGYDLGNSLMGSHQALNTSRATSDCPAGPLSSPRPPVTASPFLRRCCHPLLGRTGSVRGL